MGLLLLRILDLVSCSYPPGTLRLVVVKIACLKLLIVVLVGPVFVLHPDLVKNRVLQFVVCGPRVFIGVLSLPVVPIIARVPPVQALFVLVGVVVLGCVFSIRILRVLIFINVLRSVLQIYDIVAHVLAVLRIV